MTKVYELIYHESETSSVSYALFYDELKAMSAKEVLMDEDPSLRETIADELGIIKGFEILERRIQ